MGAILFPVKLQSVTKIWLSKACVKKCATENDLNDLNDQYYLFTLLEPLTLHGITTLRPKNKKIQQIGLYLALDEQSPVFALDPHLQA